MIGERIRLAREACGLTQQQLASHVGLSQGALSAVEAGQGTVSDDALRGLASVTGFPISFFHMGPLPDMPEGYFRKLKRGTAKGSKQFRAQVRQVVELVERAERELRLPQVRLEPVKALGSIEDIEAVAQTVRHQLGVGTRDPIPNLIRAVERAGVVVVRLNTTLEDHDSFSVWPDYGLDGRPVIAISGGHPGDRDRANTAHELGHLVLHTLRANVDPEVAEREAWRFAGALLIPAESALEAMPSPVTMRVLMGVKATYGTSIAFNAQVAKDTGLISQEQFVSLRKQLSARGWLRDEPLPVECEQPVLIPKIVEHMAGSGSQRERMDRLGVQTFLLPSLTGRGR